MTVTDLVPQKKKGRINVYLDGEYVCALEEITVLEYRIKIGSEMTEERLHEIKTESEKQSAFDKAVKYVVRARKSEKQITDYLTQKEYSNEVIQHVVEKLAYYDYINDQSLAQDYVEYYKNSRGINRIKQDLKRMGIDDTIIYDAMQQIDDQYEACLKYGQKYVKSHPNADKVKLYNHLASKGFGYDVVRKVTTTLTNADVEDDI